MLNSKYYIAMRVSELVRNRIENLLEEKKMTVYRLGLVSGVLPGSLNGLMRARNNSVDLTLIIKIAKGFKIDLSEFFNDPIFKDIELEK